MLRALAVLYRDIARPWTADEVSREVDLSRSVPTARRVSPRLGKIAVTRTITSWLGSLIQQVQFSRRFHRLRGKVTLLVTKSSDFLGEL